MSNIINMARQIRQLQARLEHVRVHGWTREHAETPAIFAQQIDAEIEEKAQLRTAVLERLRA